MIDIKKILCPIDFSDYSDHALKYAVKMALWFDASVRVLHVMPLMPPSTLSPLAEASRQLTLKSLTHTVDRWWRPDVTIEQELIESAEPAERILDRAESLDADLIVTGSHGRTGVERILLGSVVERLLHRSRSPILIIPKHVPAARLDRAASFNRIVCGVDFGSASIAGLAYALAVADEAEARLTVVNVIEQAPGLTHRPGPNEDAAAIRADAEAAQLTKLRALVPDNAGDYCSVEAVVAEGGASHQLLQMAAAVDADLIVLGVHGRNRLDLALFGSNTRDIVTQAQCPVLVVPAGHRQSGLRAVS